MKKIRVIRSFSLRVSSDSARKEFSAGEHRVTDEEYGHWYMQAALEDGRAILMAVAEPEEKEASGETDAADEREAEGAAGDAAQEETPEAPIAEPAKAQPPVQKAKGKK